ncbi:VOC family protein [Prauserella oleivorans]|uniref:VOC family protein n=1 Tax=Prauserella oleivorans TaxID=1478153 RepID=A0ABW5W4G9_9PSEU
MNSPSTTITLGVVALDCPDPYALATFYGELLGWRIAEGDQPGDRWVDLVNPDGGTGIAFQQDPDYQPPTWPSNERAQMLHLDFTVPSIDAEHQRVLDLGARLLDDTPETFRVYADPAGHPFCLCAA